MPIVMSKNEWARIHKWTNASKESADVVRRREYVKYLNQESRKMTKDWPNSLENVNKRNEEMRRARIDAAEKANSKFYKRYVRRKKEEQQRLMYNAKDIVFKNKDAPKLLLSAVLETVVQKERSEQLKFRAERRKEQEEIKKQDDDDVIRQAKEWNELMASRKQKRFEANKQYQKEILDQAKEVADRNMNEYMTELHMQKEDNMKADQQMNALKEFEEKFEAAEKARILSDMTRSRQEAEKRRTEQAARDLLDDRLLEVLQRSRATVESRRKQTEKETKEEKLRILEAISKKLESGDAAREAKEQAMLEKAMQENNAINEARHVSQAKKLQEIRQDRIEQRKLFLRDEKQRVHELKTMRQWDIMNRFKNNELYEDFQENLRLERERKIQEYRDEILRLWKEREDRENKERAETRYFYGELAEKKLRDADNKLLTHANELLDEARRNDRPDYALRKAVDLYCKLYRLYPMPELPSSLQEHYGGYAARDGSSADPTYRPPTPPPSDHGPDAPDTEPLDKEKRHGLQDPKPGHSNQKSSKEESVEDYKRIGRANGLQRKIENVPATSVKEEMHWKRIKCDYTQDRFNKQSSRNIACSDWLTFNQSQRSLKTSASRDCLAAVRNC